MFENSNFPTKFREMTTITQTWLPIRLLQDHPIPTAEHQWSDIEASIGDYRSTRGAEKYWDIIGPIRETTNQLKAEIKTIFDLHAEDLKNRDSITLMYEVFMVGSSKSLANPTLIIICHQKSTRKKAMKLIEAGKILEKPCYLGVRIDSASRHPRYPKSRTPQAIGSEIDLFDQLTFVHSRQNGEAILGSHLSPAQRTPVFIRKGQALSCGLTIFVPTGKRGQFKKATLGGFLDITRDHGKRSTMGLTVAHAFEFQTQEFSYTEDDSDSEGSSLDFKFEEPIDEGKVAQPTSAQFLESPGEFVLRSLEHIFVSELTLVSSRSHE